MTQLEVSWPMWIFSDVLQYLHHLLQTIYAELAGELYTHLLFICDISGVGCVWVKVIN